MFALVNEFAEMLLSVIYGLIADVDVSSVLVCAGCVCFVAMVLFIDKSKKRADT
jgi:hypothetical protein